jgi:hypothetical protein
MTTLTLPNEIITKILNEVRANYISDCYNTYGITLRQIKQYHNVHFKYTFLHKNHKKVCNDIKIYKLNKHPIFEKKLSSKILLERGIVINYNKKI